MHQPNFNRQRQRMVNGALRDRGIRDQSVLDAMNQVSREEFVPEDLRESAYHDCALPIGSGQTISQPYIVALMTEALQLSPGDRILEIGTGSGYAAAVLSRIAESVFSIERIQGLAKAAADRLKLLGYRNVHVACGDGTRGWPEHAPFDAIVVTAGGPHVPQSLLDQLKVGGRLVMPVGNQAHEQQLIRVTRLSPDRFDEEELGQVVFVPLIGKEGWHEGSGHDHLDSPDPSKASTVR